jgi:hypothetical protein
MIEILQNMSQWIFKAIYYPIGFMLLLAGNVLLIYMLSEAGWDTPIRWLAIIATIAFIADYFVNK